MKIYIYGYLNRVQSSRRLERECQRNIELVWLTGRLMPDFKTIADFSVSAQRSDLYLLRISRLSKNKVLQSFTVRPRWASSSVGERERTPLMNSKAISAALAMPDVAKKLADLGLEAIGSSPQIFAETIASERKRWEPIAREAGVRLD